MEAGAFERVYQAFQEFHTYFAGAFGRKQWREHSMHYLQGLLVQSQERRNAENLSEMVPVSARSMQRFLTEARWDDDAVIARLQEYLAPKLEHPLAVWVFDDSDFPKQGVKSARVARQYCGALGKIANCQTGVFLAHVGPRGRALVDKRLYLPRAWSSDACRCAAAGVPEDRRSYRAKTDLALEMLEQARAQGCLSAGWAAGDDAFGMSPAFRDGLAAQGMQYVLDGPAGHDGLAAGTCLDRAGLSGIRAPPPAQTAQWTAPDHGGAQLGAAGGVVAGDYGGGGVPGTANLPVRCPEGAGNPGTRSLVEWLGQSTAGTWTAANPATTCPMLWRIPRWRPWYTREAPGGALKRSLRRRRATWGWMSTRPALGRAGITTWPCACWAGLFCWVCSRTGGKKMPRITRPQSLPSCKRGSTGWCGRCCPGNGSGRLSCCGGSRIRRIVTNEPGAPMPSAAPHFVHLRTSLLEPSL